LSRSQNGSFTVVNDRKYIGDTKVIWLHISDLHISKKWTMDREIVINAFWLDVQDLVSKIGPVDCVFLTGDVAYFGESDDYDLAIKTFFNPLRKHLEVDSDQVFIIPGNHDVCVRTITPLSNLLSSLSLSSEQINSILENEVDRTFLFSKHMEFNTFFEDFRSVQYDDTKLFYVQTLNFDGRKVAIIGLNSSWLSTGIGEAEKSKLAIGEVQVRKALKQIKDADLVIALMHHPFEWLQPEDRKQVEKLLRRNCHLILQGHLHKPDFSLETTFAGETAIIPAGALYVRPNYPCSYNLVHIDLTKGSGNAYFRTFNAEQEEWTKDLIFLPKKYDGKFPFLIPKQNQLRGNGTQDYPEIYELVKKQLQYLKNRPMLAHLYDEKESLEFLFSSCYIDPPICLLRNPPSENQRLNSWNERNLELGKSMIIIGRPGIGKTTAMINIYMKLADNFILGKSKYLPIFITTSSVRPDEIECIEDLMLKVANIYHILLPKDCIKIFSKWVILIIDGIDEFFREPSIELEKMAAIKSWSLLSGCSHALSVRSDFFRKYLSDAEFCSKYSEIVDLQEWSLDSEIELFINSYFQAQGLEGKELFRSFLFKINHLVRTPLSLTLVLFIWRYDMNPYAVQLSTITSLYDGFLNSWLRREIGRPPALIKDIIILRKLLECSAWIHFSHRKGKLLTLLELVSELAKQFKICEPSLNDDSGFLSLLRLRKPVLYEKENILIEGFLHESIEEFLVSRVIISTLLGKQNSSNLVKLLSVTYNYDINLFVRETFDLLHINDKNKIGKKLSNVYFRYSNSPKVNIGDSALYYLGRLGTEYANKTLNNLFNKITSGEMIEHPMVKGTIASGLIIMGDIETERIYLNNLKNDTPDDIRNRKYHLVYYGDKHYEGPDGFLIDQIMTSDDWGKTRSALVKRFKSKRKRDIMLRAFDLVTFRRFCETRRYFRMSPEERESIDQADKGLDNIPEDKIELIKIELTKLKKLLL